MNSKAKNLAWPTHIGIMLVELRLHPLKASTLLNDMICGQQTTARDPWSLLIILLRISWYSKIHKQASSYCQKTPYEETFETYNTREVQEPSIWIGRSRQLKKTGSSPRGAFNYIATVKHGEQRIISVIIGRIGHESGWWVSSPFGNADWKGLHPDYE